MNKLVYLSLSILEISEKLVYMGTYNFIIHIKNKDIYEDIAYDVEKRYDTSSYEFNRPLSMKNKNKKVIGLIKNKMMTVKIKKQKEQKSV